MIKLKDLLNVNTMTYSDDVKPKHQKKMDMETELIGDVIVPEKLYPENSSQETIDELQWLLNYNDGFIDRDFVEEGDDVEKKFKEYCKDNNLHYDEKYYGQLLKESTKTILILKYHYNRPRPYQLGEHYGIPDFKIHNLDSAKTPAYPSGHTTQAYVIYHCLSKLYPSHSDSLKQIADFVSNSRIMARAHYPSDISFGKVVAKYIVGAINDKT